MDDDAFGKYWWIFAILSAVVAVGLVIWRLPSIRASIAALKPAAPKRARRVEPESEYESDSDDGELGEARLLAHLVPPTARVEEVDEEAEEECERAEPSAEKEKPAPAPVAAPKKRGRKRAA
jgi:hypothetical protein